MSRYPVHCCRAKTKLRRPCDPTHTLCTRTVDTERMRRWIPVNTKPAHAPTNIDPLHACCLCIRPLPVPAHPTSPITLRSLYRRITLPSRLIAYFWPTRIGKPILWPKRGLNKKIFEAESGSNRPKTGKNVPKTKKKTKARIEKTYICYIQLIFLLPTVGRDCLHGHGSFSADRGAENHKKKQIRGRKTQKSWADRGHSKGASFLKSQPNRAARTALDSPSSDARVHVLSALFRVRVAKNMR
jgi:hypothetical protein